MGLTGRVVAIWKEASSVVPVGVRSYATNCALTWTSLLVCDVVRLATRPATKDDHVFGLAQKDVAWLKLCLGNRVGDLRQGKRSVTGLSSFPSHAHVARAVCAVAAVAACLTVGYVVGDPSLSTSDHSSTSQATNTGGCVSSSTVSGNSEHTRCWNTINPVHELDGNHTVSAINNVPAWSRLVIEVQTHRGISDRKAPGIKLLIVDDLGGLVGVSEPAPDWLHGALEGQLFASFSPTLFIRGQQVKAPKMELVEVVLLAKLEPLDGLASFESACPEAVARRVGERAGLVSDGDPDDGLKLLGYLRRSRKCDQGQSS